MRITNNKGFSLVELMVVVAIIGILATMSVGAVQKQLAKTRQSEVKTNLSSLYTAEKAFAVEFDAYYGGFGVIKFDVEGNALYYNVGFTATGALPAGYTAPLPAVNSVDLTAYCPASGNCAFKKAGAALTGTVTPTAAAFTAAGAGSPYKAVVDRWTINQNKALIQTADGIQ